MGDLREALAWVQESVTELYQWGALTSHESAPGLTLPPHGPLPLPLQRHHRHSRDYGTRRLLSVAMPLAQDLLQTVGNLPPLSKDQRESLTNRITRTSTCSPPSDEDWLSLARLSYRQLRRLKKSSMGQGDRMVAKALELLKK